MFYPYLTKQTKLQYLLNTFDFRIWPIFGCWGCAWEYNWKKLIFIIMAGCPLHD